LGTLGPVAALGPVRVLGAAAWVGGAAGETLTGPGRRAAAAPGAARPGRLARGGERARGRRRRDGRTRRRDLPDHVVPGRDLVAGRGHARRVVQPLEFTDLAALHQRDDHAGGPGAGRAARAVQVVLVVVGRVELHDQVDIVDMDTTGRDVGGDQD